MMKQPNRETGLGYEENVEPTEAQIRFKDRVDNLTLAYLESLAEAYAEEAGEAPVEVDGDIRILTDFREKAEGWLKLPDIY